MECALARRSSTGALGSSLSLQCVCLSLTFPALIYILFFVFIFLNELVKMFTTRIFLSSFEKTSAANGLTLKKPPSRVQLLELDGILLFPIHRRRSISIIIIYFLLNVVIGFLTR